MNERLDQVDQAVSEQLESARREPSCRAPARNALYELLRGVVVAHVLHELEQFYGGVPLDVRYEEAATFFVQLLSDSFRYLEVTNWSSSDGFGIVNPKKARQPTHLRRCLTTAVAREARKGCDVWLREHSGSSDIAADAADMELPNPLASLQDDESRQALSEILSTLPSRLREPLVLHCILGWPLRTVAKVLGTSHPEILRRVREAEEIIRPQLGRYQ